MSNIPDDYDGGDSRGRSVGERKIEDISKRPDENFNYAEDNVSKKIIDVNNKVDSILNTAVDPDAFGLNSKVKEAHSHLVQVEFLRNLHNGLEITREQMIYFRRKLHADLEIDVSSTTKEVKEYFTPHYLSIEQCVSGLIKKIKEIDMDETLNLIVDESWPD